MSTRKTLKDFFQSKGSVQNSISINPDDLNNNGSIESGDDLGKDYESGEDLLDLENNATGLLGDYVSFLMSSYDHTNGTFNSKVSNFYRPGPKNSKAPNANRGNRAHSPLGSDGLNKVFASENTTLGRTLSKYSNSGYISNLDNIVKKEGDPLNNEILSFDTSQSTNKGDTFVNQQINQNAVGDIVDTFQGYNRYYPSKNSGDGLAYAEKGATTSQTSNEKDIEMYNELGSSNKINEKVRIENLFKLVPDLLQTYTGIKKSDILNKNLVEIEEIFKNNNEYEVSSQDLKSNIQKSMPDSLKDDGYQTYKNDVIQDERSGKVLSGDYSDLSNENEEYIIYLGSVRLKIITELISAYFESNNIQTDKKKSGYISKIRGASRIPGILNTTYKLSNCIDEGLFILFGTKYSTESQFEDIIYNKNIKESKHFWTAMFKQVIKDSNRLVNTLDNSNSQSFLKMFSKSRIAQFINMVARVGDISLYKTNGEGISNSFNIESPNVLDVDKYEDNLSTIISKNKTKEGKTSWNQGSTPSMYLMPGNVNAAAMSLGTGVTGTNPLRASLNGRLSKETYITPAEGDFSKIPIAMVQEIENKLEASYVPFYFHDLRTNEIISFHAFLNQLSDSFSPGYNPVTGYGRMDPVQVYRSTSRTINVGFTIAATSKKDFNEMWWKINKLLTLLYPQWSKGTRVFDEASGNHFIQPFSQIIEASPMIRLRVGDVIKSNYSELSLARKFGIGNHDTIITGRPGPGSSFGIKSGGLQLVKQAATKAIDLALHSAIMLALGAPFANYQLGEDIVESLIRSSGIPGANSVATLAFDTVLGEEASIRARNSFGGINFQSETGKKIYNKFLDPNVYGYDVGPTINDKVILAATLPDFPYYSLEEERYFHIHSSLTGIIKNTFVDQEGIKYFEITVNDIDSPSDVLNKVILARFEDFILSPDSLFLSNLEIFSSGISDFLSEGEEVISTTLSKIGFENVDIDVFRSILSSAVFMSPYASALGSAVSAAFTKTAAPTGNPFVRAFNTTKGRGLPGFISSFSIDLMSEDSTWELDYNARAPKLVKVTFGFSPVHDITPGIDHSGFNTAPIYNVGDIMKDAAGDVWSSKDVKGSRSFKNRGSVNDK
jgi:hypothetical protein